METKFISWLVKMAVVHEDLLYMYPAIINYRDPTKRYRKKTLSPKTI